MTEKLIDFLKRFPWASQSLLENYFGADEFDQMLEPAKDELESFKLEDGELHYSAKPIDYGLVPGIYRRDMVRQYMIDEYGYDILTDAESPCFNADFRAFDEEKLMWIRVWGDMGNLSPDSLLIAINPPVFADNLTDIIVTCGNWERAAFLNIQIENKWKKAGENSVKIISLSDGTTIIPQLTGKTGKCDYTPSMEEYPKITAEFKENGQDSQKSPVSCQTIKNQVFAMKSLCMSIQDIRLLIFIACNPFLKKNEIALLHGGDSCDANNYHLTEAEHDRIIELLRKVRRLEDNEFLKRITKGPMKDTYVLTWQSIDILAAYFGTIPLYMEKYSYFPLQSFSEKDYVKNKAVLKGDYPFFDSHCHYKQRWGIARPEHQILVKEFSSALLTGARSLKSEFDVDIEVSKMTTISTSLKIVRTTRRQRSILTLRPDGCCDLVYKVNNKNKRMKLFFEIERNTNHKDKVLEKVEKYRKYIPAAKYFYKDYYDEFAVIFLYDDTDSDYGEIMEKSNALLEQMRKYGILGYIGLVSEARKFPDGWLPKHGNEEVSACGNMYVYDNMWRSSADCAFIWKHNLLHAFEKIWHC